MREVRRVILVTATDDDPRTDDQIFAAAMDGHGVPIMEGEPPRRHRPVPPPPLASVGDRPRPRIDELNDEVARIRSELARALAAVQAARDGRMPVGDYEDDVPHYPPARAS